VKIVIAEYILGGGLVAETLPSSLAREADMMLQALLAELKPLNQEIAVMLDWRYQHRVNDDVEKIILQPEDNFFSVLKQSLGCYDVFWPIAPESGQILSQMVESATQTAVKIIASEPATIRLCSDKLATTQHLAPVIAVPETHKLADFTPDFSSSWVVKPIDGAGCEQTVIVDNQEQFLRLTANFPTETFIIQALVPGRAISLSALFRNGQGWLLTINEQVISHQCGTLSLSACQVNCRVNDRRCYQQYIDIVAKAIPGLWGYVGIDLIERDNGQLVFLEINPRLTTSYAGIYSATGINVSEQILQLLTGEPVLSFKKHKTIRIDLS
jgi:predicted ATP-grasp superfamily ATP-dependent carboligase